MTRRAAVIVTLVGWLLAHPAAAQTPWPADVPPRPLPAPAVVFPEFQTRTLSNGLQVVAVPHHEQPTVSLRLLVRAGAALDPPAKAGLADLTAALLTEGGAGHPGVTKRDAIDGIGATVAVSAGADLTSLTLVALADRLEDGVQLLSDLARRPAFAAVDVERQRRQAQATRRAELDVPGLVADAVFDRLVYGAHPYALPRAGTPETLAAIDGTDLATYHRQFFVPNNAILAIAGDVSADAAFAAAEAAFADWARGDTVRPPAPAPPAPSRQVVVVNIPGATQTEVRVGHLGVPRGAADYLPLSLALRVLGGEGGNRLHRVLRTERGLTYGAQAQFDTRLESGDIKASTSTGALATADVLRLTLDQFLRLQREPISERELAGVRDYLTGSFPLSIETPEAIAAQVLPLIVHGLSLDGLRAFRERVAAVQVQDVERAVRTHLRPDQLTVVLVGDAATFTPQLRGLGFDRIDVVELADLDLLSANLRRAGGPRTVPPGTATASRGLLGYQPLSAQSARSQPAARTLLAEVIAAKGGLDRLRGLTSLVVTSRSRALGPDAPASAVDTITTVGYPNRVRIETRGEQGTVLQVYDGSRAWVRDDTGVREVPERLVGDLEAALKRDVIGALLAAQDGRITARVLPTLRNDDAPDAGRTQALEFSGPGFDPMVLYIDARSHLVVRQAYATSGMGALVEELFDDYRMVDGLQIAFKATVRVRGENILERQVTDAAVNRPLGAGVFARPAP